MNPSLLSEPCPAPLPGTLADEIVVSTARGKTRVGLSRMLGELWLVVVWTEPGRAPSAVRAPVLDIVRAMAGVRTAQET